MAIIRHFAKDLNVHPPENAERSALWPLAAVALSIPAIAWAQPLASPAPSDTGWATLTVENNNLGSDRDRYYVNGFNLAYLSAPTQTRSSWPARTTEAVERALPLLFTARGQRDGRFEWTVLGQQIFTPANKSLATPPPADRPYAAWLYTGASLMQDVDGRELDDLDLTLGVVGPAALGRQVQNGFHQAFGYGSANGWSHQLRNEPALTIAYERKWRLSAPLQGDSGLGVDLVPELGATLGNVHTYAEATALLRLGYSLQADYGPRLLQPGATGGGYFNPGRVGRAWGLYAFAGWQGRAVGHNIFLDGNTYQHSPSVAKYPWVHDVFAGLSMYGWRRVRVELSYIRRSDEFPAQQSPEAYGSATVSVAW